MEGKIEISAIIATYNRAKYIPEVLASLKRQTLDPNNFEIVIIDNNCTDSTQELCSLFINENPGLKISYHFEKNQGLSFGRNKGIEVSKGEILTFIDDDAYLDEFFLEKSVEYLKTKPDVLAIGGKILLHYEESRPYWATHFLEPFFGHFNLGDKEKQFIKNYPRGSNMTFRSEAFQKYEAFNTKLGRIGKKMMGAEEKELFDRLKNGQSKIMYVPGAVVYHFVPAERTTNEFLKKQAIGVGSSERFRTLSNGGYFKRVLIEVFKWGATTLLSIFYLFSLRPSKGIKLFFIRYFISKGLLSDLEE